MYTRRESTKTPNENIENSYSQLTNVVNDKNEIKTSIALKNEELSKNQNEIEELKNALDDIRIEPSSHPILKKLNVPSGKDAISQRMSAGMMYSESPEISSKLDLHDESSAKFNKDHTELEKLHSSEKEQLQDHIGELTLSKEEEQNHIHESKPLMKHDISLKFQALLDEFDMSSDDLSEEKDNSKSLFLQIEKAKLKMFQKFQEIFEQNSELMMNLDNLETNNKDITSHETTLETLSCEISQLFEKKLQFENKVEQFKREIIDDKISQTKLSEISTKHYVLPDGKATQDSINTSKINSAEKNEEFLVSRENELIQEIEQLKFESSKMFEEIDELIKEGETLVEQEGMLLSKNNYLKEKLGVLTLTVSNVIKNKNELETTLNDNIPEITELEQDIRQTSTDIEELNDEILNLYGKFDEIEEENEILDIKIRKYLKEIEFFKRYGAATIGKPKCYRGPRDSEDPKKG